MSSPRVGTQGRLRLGLGCCAGRGEAGEGSGPQAGSWAVHGAGLRAGAEGIGRPGWAEERSGP